MEKASVDMRRRKLFVLYGRGHQSTGTHCVGPKADPNFVCAMETPSNLVTLKINHFDIPEGAFWELSKLLKLKT